ncbi:MAG: hypothetical protein IJR69_07465 [Bacteroidaceae bacterium]|nr:hypothetical protein [Bacteroidaceae bacterium]
MMKKLFFLILCCFAGYVSSEAQLSTATAWGDQGDGTYVNPVLNAEALNFSSFVAS